MSEVLEGRNYNGDVRVRKLAYEVFTRVALEEFCPCLDESRPADSHQVQDVMMKFVP